MVLLELLVNVPDVCINGQRGARVIQENVKVGTMGGISVLMVMRVGAINLFKRKWGPAVIMGNIVSVCALGGMGRTTNLGGNMTDFLIMFVRSRGQHQCISFKVEFPATRVVFVQ